MCGGQCCRRVEPTALFVRGIGDATDIVEKEMYTFDDHGESLTLRPEATAGIVRAAIEHNLTYERAQRVWTAGPMFRHERPQKGRYRQFHQLDAEALGYAEADVDAEQIVMLARLWKRLGLAGMSLNINSIGDPHERLAHRNALAAYFQSTFDKLDESSKRRVKTNPLRILDSKNPEMQSIIAGAPKLADHLDAQSKSRQHFLELQALLEEADIAFEVNPRLVRGLDYYNRTVFEWITDRLGAQGTVAGGGRYDFLFSQLGGDQTPACGFGRPCGQWRHECFRAPGRRSAARCRAHGRRQLRRREHQGTDEKSRRERRALGAYRRRRRGERKPRRGQTSARRRRSDRAGAGRSGGAHSCGGAEHVSARLARSLHALPLSRGTGKLDEEFPSPVSPPPQEEGNLLSRCATS